MKGILRKFYLIVAVFGLWISNVCAQTTTTAPIRFKLEDVSDKFEPLNVELKLAFRDSNNDNALDAEEEAVVLITIDNSSGGPADDVMVKVAMDDASCGVEVLQSEFHLNIPRNGIKEIQVPLKASLTCPTGEARLRVNLSEPDGYDEEGILHFKTYEFQKSQLQLLDGAEITDFGAELKAANGNPDNKLQNKDIVKVTLSIQNIGQGAARDVNYKLVSNNPNLNFRTYTGWEHELSGHLSDVIYHGGVEQIEFYISPNAHYVHTGDYVPVYLTVQEERGVGGFSECQVQIPFDKEAAKPVEYVVESRKREEITWEGGLRDITLSSSKYKNIMLAPEGREIHGDAVAVVIGLENYKDETLPPAPYALRDAEVMETYFEKSLKISKIHKLVDEEVTLTALEQLFDAKRGSLAHEIIPKETELYLYFSGHGVPVLDKSGHRTDVAIIPYDVTSLWIDEHGYSLTKLYDNLAALDAKSVTVILDACFSGTSKMSDNYSAGNISKQKLVLVTSDDMAQPWLDNPNFRVFASSRSDQPSHASDATRSGLFTYHLAVGLQGEADKDDNGVVSMTELQEYVTSKVMKETNDKQCPQFFGNSDFDLVNIR